MMFFCLCCLSFGRIEDSMNRTFSVGSGGTLTLGSDIGSIQVQGGNEDSVDIEVLRQVKTNNQKKADEILEDFDIRFRQSGNDVSIQATYKKRGLRRFWSRIGNTLRVRFIVSVPSDYNVDLNTKGGSISVQDLQGEVSSDTSGGSLTFDKITGDITGKTSGGSISIGRVAGRSNIRTSGGSIRISLADGPVDAHTSGGSITIEEVMGSIKAHTSGGSVRARISKQPESDCSLTTSGGSITVHLSEGFGLDLDAKTSGGHVRTEIPLTVSGEISKRAVRARMNDGGPQLYLRTSGGSIYLKRL